MSVNWDSIKEALGYVLAAVTVVAVVWAPVSCVRNSDEKIAAAIQKGVDPISAYCSHSNQPNITTCSVRAATLGKQVQQ